MVNIGDIFIYTQEIASYTDYIWKNAFGYEAPKNPHFKIGKTYTIKRIRPANYILQTKEYDFHYIWVEEDTSWIAIPYSEYKKISEQEEDLSWLL